MTLSFTLDLNTLLSLLGIHGFSTWWSFHQFIQNQLFKVCSTSNTIKGKIIIIVCLQMMRCEKKPSFLISTLHPILFHFILPFIKCDLKWVQKFDSLSKSLLLLLRFQRLIIIISGTIWIYLLTREWCQECKYFTKIRKMTALNFFHF